MYSEDVIDRMAAKLQKTGNWKLRQQLGTITEVMANEITPFQLQISERRFRDAADYMLAAYGSAKELIKVMDERFPEIKKMDRI